jgi:hypothetical protein
VLRALRPERLAADTACGIGKFLGWFVNANGTTHGTSLSARRTIWTVSSHALTSSGISSRALHLPQREAAADQRHGARSVETRLRCLSFKVEVLWDKAHKFPCDLHEFRQKMKTKAFARPSHEREVRRGG